MKTRSLRIAGAIAIVLTVMLVIVGYATRSSQSAIGSNDWPDFPPFEMTYKDWSLNRGVHQSGGHVQVKVIYTDRFHYRIEILEDTAKPDACGTTIEASPEAMVTNNPTTGFTSSIPVERGIANGVDDWLYPGLVQYWIATYDAAVGPTDIEGINQMTYSEQVPCIKEMDDCENYNVVVEAKYRTDQYIPMERVITRDGVERRRTTVLDFKWLDAGR